MKKPNKIIKILFVDDEEILHIVFSMLIEGTDIECIHAYSGKEALQLAEKNADSLDLLMLDISLQDVKGSETYKLIRKIPGLEKVPVIFQTGHSDVSSYYKDDETVHFLFKPYGKKQLTDSVQAALKITSVTKIN